MEEHRLEVTNEILDRVVYGMENQIDLLFLDPVDGTLKSKNGNDSRLVPLPPWGPADGYRLMDKFAGTLPRTNFVNQLQSILTSESGVFRRFKDTLAEKPEMEKLWRRFKMREMRKTALAWLSRWSEALALEGIGPEPEDWDEIALTDFTVREACGRDMAAVLNCDKAAQIERRSYDVQRERGEAEIIPEETFVAIAPSGELVGFAWLRLEDREGLRVGRLLQLYVLPDFRGLGIGKILGDKSFSEAVSQGAGRLSVCIPRSSRLVHSWLERNGFQQEVVTWEKAVNETG